MQVGALHQGGDEFVGFWNDMTHAGGVEGCWHRGAVFEHDPDDNLDDSAWRGTSTWTPMVVVGPIEPDFRFAPTCKITAKHPAAGYGNFLYGRDVR